MPDTDTAPARKPRSLPAGIDPLAKALIGVIDDQHDSLIAEVRMFRRLAWAALGAFFVLQVILVFALIESRGIDSMKVAESSEKMVKVAAPLVAPSASTTPSTPAVTRGEPPPLEPEEPPGGPTGQE